MKQARIRAYIEIPYFIQNDPKFVGFFNFFKGMCLVTYIYLHKTFTKCVSNLINKHINKKNIKHINICHILPKKDPRLKWTIYKHDNSNRGMCLTRTQSLK